MRRWSLGGVIHDSSTELNSGNLQKPKLTSSQKSKSVKS